MTESLFCPECEKEIESTDDLEEGGEITEIETEDDGAVTLFENHDLFLCEGCKRPLGTSRP